MPNLTEIVAGYQALQDEICTALEQYDGQARFEEDLWDRPGGGGGRSRLIRNGHVFEQGGVNFSHVHGVLPAAAAKQLKQEVGGRFDATGVSIVMHPKSPMMPIIHMNVRYFQMEDGTCWFGGGIDLTPIYVSPTDASFFHKALKRTCDAFDSGCYPVYKKQCDEYFTIKHRQEMRGIGGIFYDHLIPGEAHSKQALFDFSLAVGKTFAPTYIDILKRHEADEWGDSQRAWQLLRRGRYVEFNLVYDRGTRFGLETGGRTASILMSLPPLASWEYDHNPPSGSLEADTLGWLQPYDWVNYSK